MSTEFKYTLTSEESKDVLNYLKKFENYSILQDPRWNNIINAHKKSCFYLKREDNNNLIAFTLIIENYLEVNIPFGPLALESEQIANAVIDITEYYQKKGKASLIFQLGIISGQLSEEIEYSIFKKIPFKQGIDISNWSTIVLNLQEDIKTIYDNFSQNHKRSLKKALKESLFVKDLVTEEEIIRFAGIYDLMYKKRKLIKPFKDTFSVFKKIFNYIKNEEKGFFLGVYNSASELLGGGCFTIQGDTAMYQYGCSHTMNNNLPVLHLAFYEAIKIAKEKKLKYFDFCGYNQLVSENDQVFQINRFKKGFGGKIIFYPKKIQFTLSKPKKFLFDLSLYIYRHLRK